jgi:hypothetical protein
VGGSGDRRSAYDGGSLMCGDVWVDEYDRE